jgi:hypothetical protein
MTHMTIHGVTNITTGGVSHSNANAITLTASTTRVYGAVPTTITIFDLPTHIADGLEELLGNGGIKPAMTEAEIRADERRKIASQIDPAF